MSRSNGETEREDMMDKISLLAGSIRAKAKQDGTDPKTLGDVSCKLIASDLDKDTVASAFFATCSESQWAKVLKQVRK